MRIGVVGDGTVAPLPEGTAMLDLARRPGRP